MLNSVRTRLTLWYVGVLALTLLLFGAGLYTLLARSLSERLDKGLRATLDLTADSLQRDLTEDLAQLDAIAVAKALTKAEAEHFIEAETALGSIEDLKFPNQAIAIFDAQGQLLAEASTSEKVRAVLPARQSSSVESIQFFTLTDRLVKPNDGLRVAVKRVQVAAKKSYLIVIAQSLKENAEALASLRQIFYIAVPMALLLAGLAGFFLAHTALNPIRAMSARAHRISADNLNERLPIANPSDELGQLAGTF
ncbi:MAG: HAMP domain-containing protein, partial [Thermosynechococcaceae cyanobacterium]